jgi:hypothetical protein
LKTRKYTLTTGEYEDYRIIARVEGPATPALSTLLKTFKEEYSVWPDSRNRLQAKGYTGYFTDELFVEWLIKEHGFTKLPYDTFYIGF